ncbi:MAG TPA: hypothetical protein VEW42_04650 [Candidatus Eisenbacteria bacterium]|nr:hypothetical protein [Candidatus Eisenbacteria bacterium]
MTQRVVESPTEAPKRKPRSVRSYRHQQRPPRPADQKGRMEPDPRTVRPHHKVDLHHIPVDPNGTYGQLNRNANDRRGY